MANVVTAQHREEKGKGPARRLRQKGLIPAVVYGRKADPTHLSLDPPSLMKAIETPHKFNTVLTLQLDGAEKHVLFKDWEVDPVTRRLLHADFLEVKLDEAVKVGVPVDITGKAVGALEGGILSSPPTRSCSRRCLARSRSRSRSTSRTSRSASRSTSRG